MAHGSIAPKPARQREVTLDYKAATSSNVGLMQAWQGMMVGTRISSHPQKKRKDTRAAWSDPSSYKNYEDTWNKVEALSTGQSINFNTESGPRLRVVGHLVDDSVVEKEPPKPEPQNAFMNVANALVLSGISDKVNEQLATAWLTAASTNSADAVSPEAIQQWLAQRALNAANEEAEQAQSFSSSIPLGNLKKQAAKTEVAADSKAPNGDESAQSEKQDSAWKLQELRHKEIYDPEKRARVEAEIKENANCISQNAKALAAATSTSAAALAERGREDAPDPASASSKSLSQAFLLSDKPSKYEPDDSGERLPTEGLVNLGNIPPETTEDGIWAECLKYGNVASVYYEIENQFALVKYPSYENALTAVEQMGRSRFLFGSSQKVEVSLVASRDLQRAVKQCEAFDPETYDPAQDQAALAMQGQAAVHAQAEQPRRRRRKKKPAEVLDLFDEAQAKKRQRAVEREQRSYSSDSDDSRLGHHRDRRGRHDDDSRDGHHRDRRDRREDRRSDSSRDGDYRDRDRRDRHRRGSSRRRQQEAAPRRRERKTGWEEPVSSNPTVPMTAFIPQLPKIVPPPNPEFFQAHGMEVPSHGVQVPQVSFPPKGTAFQAHGLSCAPVAGFRSAEVRFNNPAHAFTAVSAAGLVLHGRVLHLSIDSTSKDASKVIVRGLAPGTHWIELKTLFSQIGPVAFVQIKEDPSQPG